MGVFGRSAEGNGGWRRRFGEPKNRRERFLCVVWDQFFSLFSINLLYMLFWLPTILWTAAHGLQFYSLMDSGNVQGALPVGNACILGLIPCLTLTGPARAGMALVMRNWATEQHKPAFRTFWTGAKENLKQATAVSFLSSLIPALLWYNGVIMLKVCSTALTVLFALLCVFGGLLVLSRQVVYTLLVTYELPLRGQLYNALLLTVMKLPQFLLVRLGTWFFLLLYAGLTALRPEMRYSLLIIPVLYYFSVGASITELAFASHSNQICDLYFPYF